MPISSLAWLGKRSTPARLARTGRRSPEHAGSASSPGSPRAAPSSVSVVVLKFRIDCADSGLHCTLWFCLLSSMALVIGRTTCQACYPPQVCQFLLLPQSGNQTRFVGAANFFDRIKACNLLSTPLTRSRSSSSRKACAESVMTLLDGTRLRSSLLILGCPCSHTPKASTPPS